MVGLYSCSDNLAAELSFFFFFFFLMVVGFEFWISWSLGKCFTTWATPPSPLCFSYFSDRVSHFCPGWPWRDILLFNLPLVNKCESSYPDFFFLNRVLHCTPGWFQTCDPPASVSWVLWLQLLNNGAWPQSWDLNYDTILTLRTVVA
jgi:hypothetical protein